MNDDRMTVIQRVYLRAEKGMSVIHGWNVPAATAATASQYVLVPFFDFLPGQLGTQRGEKGRQRR